MRRRQSIALAHVVQHALNDVASSIWQALVVGKYSTFGPNRKLGSTTLRNWGGLLGGYGSFTQVFARAPEDAGKPAINGQGLT